MRPTEYRVYKLICKSCGAEQREEVPIDEDPEDKFHLWDADSGYGPICNECQLERGW